MVAAEKAKYDVNYINKLALLLYNARLLAAYPVCSEKLPSLVHIINRSSDIRSRLQTLVDALFDA